MDTNLLFIRTADKNLYEYCPNNYYNQGGFTNRYVPLEKFLRFFWLDQQKTEGSKIIAFLPGILVLITGLFSNFYP